MPVGPGKYDNACTQVRKDTSAIGVVLIVVGGMHGDGFSCQMPYPMTATLPTMLRRMADDIEEALKEGRV